jgi:hypothetical protein
MPQPCPTATRHSWAEGNALFGAQKGIGNQSLAKSGGGRSEWVTMTAHSRIPDLLKRVTANPHFDPAGHHIGRAQMILGLFYKVKKKRALALQHLTEARRILSQFGQTPILGGSIRLLRN